MSTTTEDRQLVETLTPFIPQVVEHVQRAHGSRADLVDLATLADDERIYRAHGAVQRLVAYRIRRQYAKHLDELHTAQAIEASLTIGQLRFDRIGPEIPTCGIHSTPIVERRCADCDKERAT